MGGDIVRLTVQGKFEADACAQIRQSLWEKGCNIPLVADIHFAPAVALRVADAFEKIRINPGNFVDGIKSFENKVYNTKVRRLRIPNAFERNTHLHFAASSYVCLGRI